MFCIKCGKKNLDNAKFCEECGSRITSKEDEFPQEDNEVLLSITPVFNSRYQIIKSSLLSWPILLFFSLMWPIISAFVIFITEIRYESEEANKIAVMLGVCVFVVILLYVILVCAVIWLRKKDIYCTKYDFYRTKLVYRNSFFYTLEKEVKYKYIREVLIQQGILEKKFDLGTIALYTNAETGSRSGIIMSNLENSQEYYKQIKKIIEY